MEIADWLSEPLPRQDDHRHAALVRQTRCDRRGLHRHPQLRVISPKRLFVPSTRSRTFVDPSVEFGLRVETTGEEEETPPRRLPSRTAPRPRATASRRSSVSILSASSAQELPVSPVTLRSKAEDDTCSSGHFDEMIPDRGRPEQCPTGLGLGPPHQWSGDTVVSGVKLPGRPLIPAGGGLIASSARGTPRAPAARRGETANRPASNCTSKLASAHPRALQSVGNMLDDLDAPVGSTIEGGGGGGGGGGRGGGGGGGGGVSPRPASATFRAHRGRRGRTRPRHRLVRLRGSRCRNSSPGKAVYQGSREIAGRRRLYFYGENATMIATTIRAAAQLDPRLADVEAQSADLRQDEEGGFPSPLRLRRIHPEDIFSGR